MNFCGWPMIDIVTIFLGTAVGATMEASYFLNLQTLAILAMGAVAFAFVFNTAGGVIFAKFLNLFFLKKKNKSMYWSRRHFPFIFTIK